MTHFTHKNSDITKPHGTRRNKQTLDLFIFLHSFLLYKETNTFNTHYCMKYVSLKYIINIAPSLIAYPVLLCLNLVFFFDPYSQFLVFINNAKWKNTCASEGARERCDWLEFICHSCCVSVDNCTFNVNDDFWLRNKLFNNRSCDL